PDVRRATLRSGNDVRDVVVPEAVDRIAREVRATTDKSGPSGVFFLGSANLSNEENFLLRKIADHVSCPNRDVVVDKARTRKIKSVNGWVEGDEAAANFRGARDMGLSPGKNGYGLDAVLSGKASPEVRVVGCAALPSIAAAPAKVAALRRARFVATLARESNALVRACDVVLPAASLAEKEGTFTNVQGRVQKFERAFLPRPPVRAHWELLLLLGNALGYGERQWTPSDLLRQIAGEVGAYRDVKETELEGGILLKKGDFIWTGQP